MQHSAMSADHRKKPRGLEKREAANLTTIEPLSVNSEAWLSILRRKNLKDIILIVHLESSVFPIEKCPNCHKHLLSFYSETIDISDIVC